MSAAAHDGSAGGAGGAPPPVRLYALYGLSGLLSLGYQVVWFRVFADRFGSSNLTFLLVLCGFIGGLGVGALASRWLTDPLAARWLGGQRLRCYGLVELAITLAVAATAVLVAIPVTVWSGELAYFLDENLIEGLRLYRRTLAYRAAEVAVALTCVAVPAILMGLTYPLLCRAYAEVARFPAALYAANTLGACLGVLAAQLVLLPTLGYQRALWLLLAANAALGWYFLTGRLRDPAPAPRSRAAAAPRPPTGVDIGTATGAAVTTPVSATLIALGAISGLLAGAIEGDLVKRIWFLGATTTAAMAFVSFWAILAIFSAAALVRALPGLGLGWVKTGAVLGVAYYALVWHVVYPARHWLEARYAGRLPDLPPDLARLFAANAIDTNPLFALLLAGTFAFPAMLGISLILPYVCNLAQAGASGHRRPLGAVYGVNTLAFCLGLVAFAWLAPRVSIFYSLGLLPWAAGLTVALLLLLRPERSPPPLAAAGWALGLALAAWLSPSGFDRAYLDPHKRAYHYPARALRSNGASTSYVIADPDGDRLYFDGRPMSSASIPAQTYMRIMAHFPLLAQENPTRALVIGFGVGNTAAGVARHESIRRIDIAELNHQVYATAPEFRATNNAVYDDPRARLFHDDGRMVLALAEGPYDLITCEPPPPVQDGVHRLFSLEYYEAAREKLSPTGLITQWLPVAQIPSGAIERMLASFTRAMPHSLLLIGHGRELVMLGGKRPIDLGLVLERWDASPAVRADLARLGITSARHLLARIVDGGPPLAARYAQQRVVSDARNDLAFLDFRPDQPIRIAHDPGAALTAYRGRGHPLLDRLLAITAHPGRLAYWVPDVPLGVLELRGLGAREQAAWRSSAELRWRYLAAHRVGKEARAHALLEQALALGLEQPWWRLEAARRALTAGRTEDTLAELARFRAVEPEADEAPLYASRAHAAAGRPLPALNAAQTALALRPSPEGWVLKGEALAALGRSTAALDAYRAALALDPADLSALRAQGRLLEALRRQVR